MKKAREASATPRGGAAAARKVKAPAAAALARRGNSFADRIRWDERGLVPVVAQDEAGGVLMLAWANREAIVATFRSGRGTYWSRSRGQLWVKGDTSGHVQHALEVALDCDGDAVLYVVRQVGPACHLGTRSCFAQREAFGAGPASGSGRARPASRGRASKRPAK